MNGPLSTSLNTVPQEVLEHIAYFTGTDDFLGPPSSIIPLLLTNRHIHTNLSIVANHHLYARIFADKFDTAAPLARFGEDRLTAPALAGELRRRCMVLHRLRTRTDSTTHARHADGAEEKTTLCDILFTVYVMLIENEGRNKRQLVEYGQAKEWIQEFWFDPHGSSLAIYNIRIGQWPLNRIENALGMWIFWFLLSNNDTIAGSNDSVESPLSILKAMALGAHIYNLTAVPWTEFESTPVLNQFPAYTTLYSERLELDPPPLATPAILSFLSLINKKRSIPLPPCDAVLPEYPFQEWDSEWGRCLSKPRKDFSNCFRPGSIEGVWEGFFTYTEFVAYAALLAGAPPPVIQKSVVGRHQQTWKLREHHLIIADPPDSDSGISIEPDVFTPLRAGDPLRSYFPTGTQITERREGLTVEDLANGQSYQYERATVSEIRRRNEQKLDVIVQDIIVTGEGHSAWGQFNIVGRIRPSDGFISLSKDYMDGDRGKWLYRGYLVGNANGNLGGRWRDTLSPSDVPGYEGCFVMSRRR
ncbi:hypothetical protein BDN70DRAFT_826067 [Pholiota conissans]|uniref:F-box domain-containing protein n=1 Tax=Pholiota conissans TaxID=109636 RepID=A0A9P5ZDX6_9AGAR|nr:hypothetical protein BDN70DRAFT_826067 [Pholiota conissans]